ncbi:hypothetical protein ABW19_dt0201942 [Dactylella cylindrospora]|nr:hypothetical protein ABW19_dt0201942 [Dactylella cylindrospora]
MAMPFQIGDAIALAQLCYGIAQAFGAGRKAAPAEFREVQNELYGLGQMLDLLVNSVEGGAFTTSSEFVAPGASPAALCVTKMISNCQQTVNHLKEFAKKYAPLAGVEFIEERSGVTVRRMTSKQRIKLNWKKIMWTKEASNIQGIRDQISIHVQSINAVVSLVNAHSISTVHTDVRELQGAVYQTRVELQNARNDIYQVGMGVQMANASIHGAHSEIHSHLYAVRQDIMSLNHKMEAIVAWQQRDMPTQELRQQLSLLLWRLEQPASIPNHMPQQQGYHPRSHGSLPYPDDSNNLNMPSGPADQSHYRHQHPSAFYASSSSSSTPNLAARARQADFRPAPLRSATDSVTSTTLFGIAELDGGSVTQKVTVTMRSSEQSREPPPVPKKPVELDSNPRPSRRDRESRATPKDIVFELCWEYRGKDGVAKFKIICSHASFHGNWVNAVKGGSYNEGLFVCLCEPFPEEEDEDFEPHARYLEAYYLTEYTLGCRYYGNAQWLLHNVGHIRKEKLITLGMRAMDTKMEMAFEKTFMEPMCFKAAKNTLSKNLTSSLSYRIRETRDNEEIDQLALLNSMADDSFKNHLQSVTFFLQNGVTEEGEKFVKSSIMHVNMLHYKTIDVAEVRSRSKPLDPPSIILLDDNIVKLDVANGSARLGNKPNVEKVPGQVEFRFETTAAAGEFLKRLRDLRNELHTLKIQHAKGNERVMVKLFAEHISAADDIQMQGVEIVVVWDERRKKGRILARSRDGSCHLSQTLPIDFFERFAEMSRGNLFYGAAEFYRPTNKQERLKKYPEGVRRFKFQDSATDDLFYARLTESARRFGFDTANVPERAPPPSAQPADKPVLQRRVSQMDKARNWRFSKAHYDRIVTETVAIENNEITAALPTHNLTRPLDAEELLDLLNQTEEKMLFTMESPKPLPTIRGPPATPPATIDEEEVGSGYGELLLPSQPSDITDADLSIPKRFRPKSRTNPGTSSADKDAPSEIAIPGDTLQSNPALLPPDANYRLHGRSKSVDGRERGRDPDSQKFMFPPGLIDGKKATFPPGTFPSNRGRSSSPGIRIPSTPPMSHMEPSNGNPGTINQENNPISDSELYLSPVDYPEAPEQEIGVIENIDSDYSSEDDREDLEVPTSEPQVLEPPAGPPGEEPPAQESPLQEPQTVDHLIPEPKVLEPESINPEKFVSRVEDPEDIHKHAGFLHEVELLTLPMVTTAFSERAYRLTSDFNEDLPKGALVWLDGADKGANKLESAFMTVRYYKQQAGGSHIEVPKSILKQARYYQMKETKKTVENDELIRIWGDDIVVPLRDDPDINKDGEGKLRVVPLGRGYSGVVELAILREVNLGMVIDI